MLGSFDASPRPPDPHGSDLDADDIESTFGGEVLAITEVLCPDDRYHLR